MKIPIISRLGEPRAGPKNNFWGSTTSGKTVNERTAMQTTAVYACVRILAEIIELHCHFIPIDTLKLVRRRLQNIKYIIS